MFQKIVVPVDLTHADRLGRALTVAADLAKTHGAEIVYLGVTGTQPSAVATSPEDYATKLDAFAAAQAEGVTTLAKAITSHDPSIDTDKLLIDAVKSLGADLVVMQTHLPNVGDYLWAGHGASVAAHTGASIFLVRD